MIKRFISVTMIVFMLFAQVGEAFAVSSMACFGNGETMAKMNQMMTELEQSSGEEMMEHECCQQECECPVGVMSLALVLDIEIQAPNLFTHEPQVGKQSRLLHTFIPTQKRPPITLFI